MEEAKKIINALLKLGARKKWMSMKEISEIKLEACPFCGGEAILYEIEPHSHRLADIAISFEGEFFVECTSCACGLSGATKDDAVKVWNRRAELTAEWDKSNGVPRCTHCDYQSRDYFNPTPDYCPRCGRKMIEKE